MYDGVSAALWVLVERCIPESCRDARAHILRDAQLCPICQEKRFVGLVSNEKDVCWSDVFVDQASAVDC